MNTYTETEDGKRFDQIMKKGLAARGYAFRADYPVYLDRNYETALRESLRRDGLLDTFAERELIPADHPKMCSIASSSRLCYLYFQGNDALRGKVEFEKGLVCLDNPAGKPQLDAFVMEDGVATYYECKCREITDHHAHNLKASYHQALKRFGLADARPSGCCFELTLGDFGIGGGLDPARSIYSLSFDMKQFVCHLLGIANAEDAPARRFQYVFFRPPTPASPEDHAFLDRLYRRLKNEIAAIEAADSILEFCADHRIELMPPRFVDAGTVPDFVLAAAVQGR